MKKGGIIEQMFKGVFGDAVKFVEVPYQAADDDDGLERQATPCDCPKCTAEKEALEKAKLAGENND